MSRPKSKPNGKDHAAEAELRRGRKPRSHAVRHPKDAPADIGEVKAPPPGEESVISQAAAVLEQEHAAEAVHHPGVTDDERELLRQALARVEAAYAELARATERRKKVQAEVDAANLRLQTVVAEISGGTNQPRLPFDPQQQEADRNAMLQADREANTPALIDRLKRFGWI